jgi:hypothetical protein
VVVEGERIQTGDSHSQGVRVVVLHKGDTVRVPAGWVAGVGRVHSAGRTVVGRRILGNKGTAVSHRSGMERDYRQGRWARLDRLGGCN